MLSAVCLLLTVGMFAAPADTVRLRRVPVDTLVSVLQRSTSQKVYFSRHADDKSEYNVTACRADLPAAISAELRSNGYNVSQYDGKLFVTYGNALVLDMPAGWFDSGEGKPRSDEYLRYVEEENALAAFRNKVYEIGEVPSGRNGKAYVSGYVRDVSSGEPMVGVSVFDSNTNTYTQTDAYGFYRLLLPLGENVINYKGYSLEDAAVSVVVKGDGGLDVVMKEQITTLKGAVVSAESSSYHRDAKMGVEKIRINVLSKVPVAFGEPDVLKVVQTLPGVKTVGEASSGFNVRGGSVDQNLILFNEGTIYNPSHMFGVFSAFNSDVINDVELYKSSIPVEYGGRISSVLEVSGREGNSKKVEGSLGIGVLTSHFHVEGPIANEKTTFIVAGRTTYSNWILNLLPQNSGYHGSRASFFDVNAGLTHKFNARNSIQFNGYYSHDKFDFCRDTTFKYNNANFSLKWRSNFSDSHSLVASVGYDRYDNTVEDKLNKFAAYSLNTSVEQAFVKLKFNSDITSRHRLTYGADAVLYRLNPGKMLPFGDSSAIVSRELPLQKGLEFAVYAGDSWRPGDKLSFEYGIRYSGFASFTPSKFYGGPEFRVSGKYSFTGNFSFKAGFNSMRQYIHLITNTASISPMDTWRLSDDKVVPQTGWQGSAGLYWSVFDSQVDLSLEAYYKSMKNYPDYKSGAVLTMNEKLSDELVRTRGKAYGVEFMVKKPFGKLNGWVSYTYSRTLLQEMENRGIETINGGNWYVAAHDQPHDFKLVGNYKFTHRFSLSLDVDYKTGRPVTIPVGMYSYGGGYRFAYSERNGYRIPDYFRMDVAFNIDPGHYLKQFTHMSFTIGVYNVTGRKNAYSVFFSSDGKQVSGYMLSVFATQIPYINLNLKF